MFSAFNNHPVVFCLALITVAVTLVTVVGIITGAVVNVKLAKYNSQLINQEFNLTEE